MFMIKVWKMSLSKQGGHMAEDSKVGQKALFFVLGGLIGAAVALLLAPQSGEETRKLIAMKTRESANFIADREKDVTEKTGGVIDRGEHRLKREEPQRNEGLVKLLLACPVKGWFKPMDRRETTDDIEVLKFG
jgi:hypothetical protein